MAGQKPFLTCSSCHEKVPREQIVFYGSANNPVKYCPSCYSKRVERDKFTNYVCELFGIRTPGPKIYSQYKSLREKHGYTTDLIIQTLEYLFRVKNLDKSYESLGLVTPRTIEEAKAYYQRKAAIREKLEQAQKTQTRELIVPVQKKDKKTDLLDINDYLED